MTFKQFRVAGVTASGFVLPAAVLLERKPNHAQKAIAAAKVRVDEEHGAIAIRRRTVHRVGHRRNHSAQHTILATAMVATY